MLPIRISVAIVNNYFIFFSLENNFWELCESILDYIKPSANLRIYKFVGWFINRKLILVYSFNAYTFLIRNYYKLKISLSEKNTRPRLGFDTRTFGFTRQCSTNWATLGHFHHRVYNFHLFTANFWVIRITI